MCINVYHVYYTIWLWPWEMAHRNRWFTWVYLLIAWWFSMAMLNNQMYVKKICRSYFPLNHSHASRGYSWGMCAFQWYFFLTKSYRPSTIFYMDLRETTSPTQGALRLPSLALPGSHSPRGGYTNQRQSGRLLRERRRSKMTRKHLGHVYEKGTQAMPAGTWATLMEVLFCFFKQKNSNQPFHQNQP